MMRRLLLAAALGLVMLPAAAAVPAQAQAQARTPDGAAIVGRSARVYRSLASLSADFVQEIQDEMVGNSESRGTLVQAGPNKLAMRFTDPAGDAIVIDGQAVWLYTPSTTPGQVIRMALPSGGPVYGFNILAWLLDRPAERYDARWLRAEAVNGRMADVVELIPRSDDLPFTRAVVALDREDGLPRRLVVDERSGGTRTITLSRLRVNGSIPESTFRFAVPSGVRVVEQ